MQRGSTANQPARGGIHLQRLSQAAPAPAERMAARFGKVSALLPGSCQAEQKDLQ